MEDMIGVFASIINAVLFFFISMYIIFIKKDKDVSHYFFVFMTISISLYGLLGIFKYSENYQVALHLSKMSLIFFGTALYFFVLFTYYLRIGINKDVTIFLMFPLLFIIAIALGPLIEGVEPSAYGWLPILNPIYLLIFSISLYIYFILGLYNLIVVYQNIDKLFKIKILYFIIGALVVLIFMIFHSISIILWKSFLPLTEISFVIAGIIYFYALIK